MIHMHKQTVLSSLASLDLLQSSHRPIGEQRIEVVKVLFVKLCASIQQNEGCSTQTSASMKNEMSTKQGGTTGGAAAA